MKTSFNPLSNKISLIVVITVAWVLVALLDFFGAYGVLLQYNCELEDVNPWVPFGTSLMIGLLAGTIGGSTMVFSWGGWLRSKTYGRALVDIWWSYTLIYLFVSSLSGFYFYSRQAEGQFVWQDVAIILFNPQQIRNYLYWLGIMLITMIFLQVNDKYGPGNFRALLFGKYFRPRREERIFMFLDLRSSTTIAEKLGERRYFNFINDVFKSVTPSILRFQGEIYQYVGDEIVITWKMRSGDQRGNCVQCFFHAQKALQAKRDYFEKEYGVVPQFKAGLHFGYVMAGEIGIVKRDISFSGDVLNTTSRIQDKCNELGVDILLSKPLVDRLDLTPYSIEPREIGEMALKGKEEKVTLVTV